MVKASESVGAPRRRVAVIGAGATGLGIVRVVLGRESCDLASVVDSAAGKAGTDVAALVGQDAGGLRVADSVDGLRDLGVDVAIVATVSRAEGVEPTISSLVEQGLHVVTICEELTDARVCGAVAGRLDAKAREYGVPVVGTGVNPGFIMDTLPLFLTAVMDSVQRIEVTRTADFSNYTGAVERFGLGLTPQEFEEAFDAGRLAGFLGFTQSISQIERALGWSPDTSAVEPLTPTAITEDVRRGLHIDLPAGTVAEVSQRGWASLGGDTIIDLRLRLGYLEQEGVATGDRITIVGGNQTLTVTSDPPGFESLSSTASIAVNVAAHASALAPGFHTTPDLPVWMLASVGNLTR